MTDTLPFMSRVISRDPLSLYHARTHTRYPNYVAQRTSTVMVCPTRARYMAAIRKKPVLARGPAEEEAAPATCRGPPKLLFFVLRPVVSSRRLLRCSEFDSERALVARPRDAPGLAAEAAAGTGVMLVASREPWNWSVKSLIERRYSIYGFWSF